MHFIGNESSWHYLFSLYGGLVVLALPTLKFIPESPKFLYTVRNDHNKALSGITYNLNGIIEYNYYVVKYKTGYF